jgi:PKD repeat protein
MRSKGQGNGIRTLFAAVIMVVLLSSPVLAGNTLTATGEILAGQVPVAQFIGTPISGPAPLTVKFTDQSANNPTSWKWEFRKGSGSWKQFATSRNPSYTFSSPGTYDIRLKATNSGGSDEEIKTNYITVLPPVRPPVARFTQDIYIGRAPLTVHFDDRSQNNPASFFWRFGDGGTSTQENPSHAYSQSGFYRVSLKVTNGAGSDTAESFVFVVNEWGHNWFRWW